MIRETIRRYILDNFMYGAAPGELRDGESLLDTGVMDSTGVMELILFVEAEFGIHVEDEEMLPENLDTVEALCRFVERKRAACSNPHDEVEATDAAL